MAADSQSSSQVGDISRFRHMDLITPTEREARISTRNREDASCAGDSLLIASSLALACGGSIWAAACLGSLAAAIQVSRVGNSAVQASELLEELL